MTEDERYFAYEFRFFATSLAAELERLSADGVAWEAQDSTETYIVSRLTIDASVKLRDRRIEVKELTERVDILEGWLRVADHDLPVAGEIFLSEAAARLGAHLESDKEASLGTGEIIALLSDHPGLKAVQLGKHRTLFDLGEECRAEFTSITILGEAVDTICIEGASVGAVLRAIARLGFGERSNESYPCYLQRLCFYAEHASHEVHGL